MSTELPIPLFLAAADPKSGAPRQTCADAAARRAVVNRFPHLADEQRSLVATDYDLVAAAAAGDEESFERLFERYRRQVARIAGRFFSQREEVEEIIQISFTE